MMEKSVVPKFISISILIVGILLVIAGISLLIASPIIIKNSIIENAPLRLGSEIEKQWSNPSYKFMLEIWTYSVLNPDGIQNDNEKPIVVRKGPYAFRAKQSKSGVKFLSENIVQYETFKYYHQDVKASCSDCRLTDKVWIPNMIYQKFVEAASTENLKAANGALLLQTPFIKVNVSDLLFVGYKDSLLNRVCSIPFMNIICKQILILPERIGFFYKMNGTSDGILEMHTGVNNLSQLGLVTRWKNLDLLPEYLWGRNGNRRINGHDGLFPPFLSKSDTLALFTSQLCRSINLTYKKDVTVEGIDSYRFVVSQQVFNSSLPKNVGYCNPNGKRYYSAQIQPGNCLPSGLLDISRCHQGAPPIVISLPNFLYSPEEVQKSIVGIDRADEQIDQIAIDFEPTTSIVLRANIPNQINVAVWKGKDINFPVDLNSFRSSIIPVLLANYSVMIDEKTRLELDNRLLNVQKNSKIAGFALIFLALIIIVLALVTLLYFSNNKEKVLPAMEMQNF